MKIQFKLLLRMFLVAFLMMIASAISARVVESGSYRHGVGTTDACHSETIARDLAKIDAKNKADRTCMKAGFFGVSLDANEYSVTSNKCEPCSRTDEFKCIAHVEFKCFKLGK